MLGGSGGDKSLNEMLDIRVQVNINTQLFLFLEKEWTSHVISGNLKKLAASFTRSSGGGAIVSRFLELKPLSRNATYQDLFHSSSFM
ncbi:hypothetical protein TNCV_3923001 [Trichonephila clavipes]|nr:hypothetical protein TNCV_3923001 [Trichonephila clavipes]